MQCVDLRLFQNSLKHANYQTQLDFAKEDYDEYKRSGVFPYYVLEYIRYLKEPHSQQS